MRILGIDPGIGRTGFGIIDTSGQKLTAVSYGCIETAAKTEMGRRLTDLYDQITGLIEEHKPEAVGIEDLFFNTNAKTALIVGQARGVIMLAVSKNKVPLAVYKPLPVNMAVTCYGRADKIQVAKMLKNLLTL